MKPPSKQDEITVPRSWFEGLIKVRNDYELDLKENRSKYILTQKRQMLLGYLASVETILKMK